MPTNQEPVISQWYQHLDKGQQFYVTAVDEKDGTVEIQHFDGDIEEMDFEDWRALDIEPSAAPEDWTGPVDSVVRDDLGYTETDMTLEDWAEPLEEKARSTEERGEEEERRKD